MAISTPYRPINCEFHDYLEHFATLRQSVTLIYAQEGQTMTLNAAIIFDLSGGRAGEYAHVKTANSELKIRMDHIISIDAIEAKSFDKGYC